MDEQRVSGTVETHLTAGGETVTARDIELLEAIAAQGSIHAATEELGRSYAHAQRRVVELEESVGPLVERQRGGSGGGGSTLTDDARALLTRFDRLKTAANGLTTVEETILRGQVIERDGELGTVECKPGQVRALVPPEGGTVEVSVRSDAVTLTPPTETPAPGETSARNQFLGAVERVESGESVANVRLDLGAGTSLVALVTKESTERLDLEPGREVVASFKATATRATETHPD